MPVSYRTLRGPIVLNVPLLIVVLKFVVFCAEVMLLNAAKAAIMNAFILNK